MSDEITRTVMGFYEQLLPFFFLLLFLFFLLLWFDDHPTIVEPWVLIKQWPLHPVPSFPRVRVEFLVQIHQSGQWGERVIRVEVKPEIILLRFIQKERVECLFGGGHLCRFWEIREVVWAIIMRRHWEIVVRGVGILARPRLALGYWLVRVWIDPLLHQLLLQTRIPKVLDLIVCSSRQFCCNLCPPVSKKLMESENEIFFLL